MAVQAFVWEDVLPIKYGEAKIVVLAESEDAARVIARAELLPKLAGSQYVKHYAGMVEAPPDKIVDVGGSIIFEWSE